MSAPSVDPGEVIGDLKDFQHDTVEYVFRRLYVDEDATDRFLVADEVGLGKTLVARGVIARALGHLREAGERVDVLYICSNADIARQNIGKLNLTGKDEFALSSRITLLPTQISDLNDDLNFISFTPKTSLDLVSAEGVDKERMLLYWMLQEIWSLPVRTTGPKNVLQATVRNKHRWRRDLRDFRAQNELAPALIAEFARVLERRMREEDEAGNTNIRLRFEELCERFTLYKAYSEEDKSARRAMIGELRSLLAMACLRALRPKLIILDEFQRFKHLLGGSDGHHRLARNLFEQTGAKILLLSATPYKMYTLDHESDEDHYRDFEQTLDFLERGMSGGDVPDEDLGAHRRELLRLSSESPLEEVHASTRRLERRLRKVMVRTEKLAASADRSGMLETVSADRKGALKPRDLHAYVALRAFTEACGQSDPIEYWKSSPYLMNFMENYKLKGAFERAMTDGDRDPRLTKALKDLTRTDALPWTTIEKYGGVDSGNARLRALLAETTDAGAWRMMWIPPSMPYYRPEGTFKEPALERFTKRLLFSAWRVVPKAVSALVSYEAERRMIRSFDKKPRNSVAARNKRGGLLDFSRQKEKGTAKERLTGMPVLSMIYPCATLAEECDPLRAAASSGATAELPTLEEALGRAEHAIEALLREIGADEAEGAEDTSWYWAAPVLMDRLRYPEATEEWFSRPDLAFIWAGERHEPRKVGIHWPSHVERAAALTGASSLGSPPEDLTRVLAHLALAGPGVTALRALWRPSRWSDEGYGEARDAAARVAWRLRLMFDLPEVAWALRGQEAADSYWRQVLRYCAEGGLQAVLDEYAHVLRDLESFGKKEPSEIASRVADRMCRALGVSTSSMRVDRVPRGKLARAPFEKESLRGHFAQRFAEERSEDGTELVTHATQVQEAFNSPFRPFVLATTSVGQEGLDFHTYCHAVVHWNLPANPVDLEQREGRVHRYKGHAVRKNLADDYGIAAAGEAPDPWERLFERGRKDREGGVTDLTPYWIYTRKEGGGAKIERRVLALPLSRDSERLDSLRRALTVYRMVFGQARQEDLIDYLLSRFGEEKVGDLAESLHINLQPPRCEEGVDGTR